MRRRRSSTALAFVLALPGGLLAQDPPEGAGTGATFLLLPAGAQATALGQAAVADGGSTEAVFWNPAGLAQLPGSEFAIHYAKTFATNNTALTAHFKHRRLGVLGVTAYLVDFGTVPATSGPGGPVGQVSTKGIELLGSYATDIAGGLAFGVNYKLIQFRNECQGQCGPVRNLVGTTHAVDLGIQYAFGTARHLTLGIAVRDAGFKLQLENSLQADPLPTRVQIGVAYRFMLPAEIPDGDRLDARVLVDLQEPWGEYGDPDALIGVDFGYRDLIRLRTGYALVESAPSGPSIGIGVKVDRFTVDFARAFYASGTLDEPAYLSVRLAL